MQLKSTGIQPRIPGLQVLESCSVPPLATAVCPWHTTAPCAPLTMSVHTRASHGALRCTAQTSHSECALHACTSMHCTALLMPPTVSVHCMHAPCCTANTSPHECALHAHTLLTPPTAFCIADCSSHTRSSLHAHHTAGVHDLPSHTQTAPAAHTAHRSTAVCLGAPTSPMHTITHLRCTPALHGQLTLHTPCAHTSHHIKCIAPCPSSTFSCSGRASARTSCPCALPA